MRNVKRKYQRLRLISEVREASIHHGRKNEKVRK